LRTHAAGAGLSLDEARLDEVCRPERYLDRLSDVFERVAGLA
jgi:adenylosuccinate lyase